MNIELNKYLNKEGILYVKNQIGFKVLVTDSKFVFGKLKLKLEPLYVGSGISSIWIDYQKLVNGEFIPCNSKLLKFRLNGNGE